MQWHNKFKILNVVSFCLFTVFFGINDVTTPHASAVVLMQLFIHSRHLSIGYVLHYSAHHTYLVNVQSIIVLSKSGPILPKHPF